jgi:PPK2 family polyphosphate:nucleotide phosphotransferase
MVNRRSTKARGRSFRDRLRVAPGSAFRLSDFDTRETLGVDKDASAALLETTMGRLADLQERLWAENRRRLLVVLQGIDTAGKGGTIEHVMGAFNPQGCHIYGFKVPTEEEFARDYLWRIHQRVPRNGEIVIFDRSHYEDVLVVRVHNLVPAERWKRRYDQINAFERLLVEEGTTIVKLFLAIDKEEQRERLQARFDDPAKRWKLRLRDLEERKRWDEYAAAYEAALEHCSTDVAPWYAIPSSRKWFRNLAVSQILLETLEELDPQLPPSSDPVPDDLVIE